MEKSHNPNRPKIQPDDLRLSKFKIFAGLSDAELQALVDLSDTMGSQEGEQIIKSGEPGVCMYVILHGAVRVTTGPDDRKIELAHLTSGDFFGEVALVDDGPRSADVTAIENCELLRITRITIGVLAGLQPGAAIQILGAIGRALVMRLRIGNQKYVDILLQQDKAA